MDKSPLNLAPARSHQVSSESVQLLGKHGLIQMNWTRRGRGRGLGLEEEVEEEEDEDSRFGWGRSDEEAKIVQTLIQRGVEMYCKRT